MEQLELGTSTLVDGRGRGLHHDERDTNTWDGVELKTDIYLIIHGYNVDDITIMYTHWMISNWLSLILYRNRIVIGG